MYVFKPVIIDEKYVTIPVFDSEDVGRFEWNSDENVEDFAKRHFIDEFYSVWQRFSVRNKSATDEADLYPIFELAVYEVRDLNSQNWLLVCHGELLDDYGLIQESVLLPFNKFNLLAFYREFILPFAGKDFEV